MTARARIALVIGCAAFALAAAGVGSACVNIHLAVTTPTAGPGDTVGFTISNTLPGATWGISVDGRGVASGVASGETVTGAFTMPDLGSESRSVGVAGLISHQDIEGGDAPLTASVAYEAPAAPQPPLTRPAHARAPVTHVATTHSVTPPASVPHVPSTSARPTAATTTILPAPGARSPAASPARRRVSTWIAPRPEPRGAVGIVPVANTATGSTPVPLPLAALAAGLFLLLAGGGAAIARRRRTPHLPEPPDEIELELQELIAEARADRPRELVY